MDRIIKIESYYEGLKLYKSDNVISLVYDTLFIIDLDKAQTTNTSILFYPDNVIYYE